MKAKDSKFIRVVQLIHILKRVAKYDVTLK